MFTKLESLHKDDRNLSRIWTEYKFSKEILPIDFFVELNSESSSKKLWFRYFLPFTFIQNLCLFYA